MAQPPAPEAAGPRPWRMIDGEIALLVRAQPRAGRDAVERIEILADGRAALRIRLKAAPVDGEANAALRRFLAKSLGLRQNEIEIAAGETARLKSLRLPAACASALAALAATS